MSGSAKVSITVGLLVVALATVVIAAATHVSVALFFGWIPLVGVGWVLTRPEPPAG
jgi:hypothetical protein